MRLWKKFLLCWFIMVFCMWWWWCCLKILSILCLVFCFLRGLLKVCVIFLVWMLFFFVMVLKYKLSFLVVVLWGWRSVVGCWWDVWVVVYVVWSNLMILENWCSCYCLFRCLILINWMMYYVILMIFSQWGNWLVVFMLLFGCCYLVNWLVGMKMWVVMWCWINC